MGAGAVIRSCGAALALGLAMAVFPAALAAQDKAASIADIRTQLSALAAELQSLRSELMASGEGGLQAAGGVTALDRMNAMEAELVRLTAQSEATANRVERVVADGTNRVGDLEFRLCELEPGCDIGALPILMPLGGPAPGTGTAPLTGAGQPELAVSEQADFDRARAALEAGEHQKAADLFASFATTYSGGPLTGEAQFLRGEALTGLGQTTEAARAYLEAFSGAPDGPNAALSLLRLGQALNDLGQVQEACVTLGEVGLRFPATAAAAEAQAAMQSLACP